MSRVRNLVQLALMLGGIADVAHAQTNITGTVRTASSAPVAGVNIDLFEPGKGKDIDLANDGTDAAGGFFTTVLDGPANYDIRFSPPFGAHLLPFTVPNVLVIGTVNLGSLTMPSGFLLTGRVLDGSLVPVAGAKVLIADAAGNAVFVPNNSTDALGQFLVPLAAGAYTVQVNPAAVAGPTLAPVQVSGVSLTADHNMGDIVLPPGFVVSATVRNHLGVPLEGVDVDVVDSATGTVLFTPGDGSDAAGFVDVTVPAGTYDIQIEPAKNLRLVAVEFVSTVVAANLNLGAFNLQSGFFLSGTVRDSSNVPVASVDVDVVVAATGAKVFTPGDRTTATGTYQVVVPPGVLDVDFEPLVSLPLRSQLIPAVNVSANTTLNAVLVACPAPSHYGTGTAGSGGFVPQMNSIGGPARLGTTDFRLRVSQGLGGTVGLMFIGTGAGSFPGNGWTLLINPGLPGFLTVVLPIPGPAGVSGAGAITLPGSIPANPTLDGVTLHLQLIMADAGAPGGLSATDGLQIPLCR